MGGYLHASSGVIEILSNRGVTPSHLTDLHFESTAAVSRAQATTGWKAWFAETWGGAVGAASRVSVTRLVFVCSDRHPRRGGHHGCTGHVAPRAAARRERRIGGGGLPPSRAAGRGGPAP